MRRKPFMIRLKCARSHFWSNLGALDSLLALEVQLRSDSNKLDNLFALGALLFQTDSVGLKAVYEETQMQSNSFMIRLKCVVSRLWSDTSTLNRLKALEASMVQTELRPNLFMIRLKCGWNRLWSNSSALKSTYDQTQLRSKHSWSRLSCARSGLWSDSVMLEVIFDQTQVRSKPFLIKFGRNWQSARARSPPEIRHKYARQSLCARSLTDPDSVALKAVYVETQVQSNSFMIRLKCVLSRLWSDSNTLNSLKALEASLIQTELRPILFLIRLKCAWNRLWSISSALKSKYDQTQLCSTVSFRWKDSWSRLSCSK